MIVFIGNQNIGNIVRKISEESEAFIPYWENLCKWASIPKQKEDSVKTLCQNYQLKLKEIILNSGQDFTKIGKIISYRGNQK